MKNSYLKDWEVTVPAGGIHRIAFPGSLFVVREASAGFDFEFDEATKQFGEGGMWIDTGVDRFSVITLYNRSATVALNVSLRIGLGSGKAGVNYDYLRKRSTVLVPTEDGVAFLPATLALAAWKEIPGVDSSGRRRSHCIVSNHNVTAGQDLLLIRSEDNFATGTCFGIVRAGQDRVVEGDYNVFLYNAATGGGISYSTETHYYL